ncbi:hypothetical protein AA0Y32_11000 [Georgenia phoenicis]|uniref:hypothetical protein n=1 Tax=unclassified Georgenia TaxID=2626815 RepID=UPI0039AFD9B4
MARERAGDGSALRPVRGLQWLWRGVLGTEHAGARWDVEVDFLDWDEKVHLYRDGVQERVQRGTSAFVLDDGARIEVRWSTYGLRRAHLVHVDGTEVPLVPAPGTAERWRADLDHERPGLSRRLALASWTVLVLALLLQVPQLLELGAGVTGWYAFTSPVELPAWLNTPLSVAAVLAGLERALRLRHHWLLD